MDARELRVGNYIKLNNPEYWPQRTGNVMMVTGLKFNRYDDVFIWTVSMVDIFSLPCEGKDPWCFFNKTDEIHQYTKFLEPIPLTEEWLLKFGFTKRDLGDEPPYVVFIRHDFAIWDFNNKYWIVEMIDQAGIERKITSIHQLQNIFHAITGDELKLNN